MFLHLLLNEDYLKDRSYNNSELLNIYIIYITVSAENCKNYKYFVGHN